jgi:hypothetical protein
VANFCYRNIALTELGPTGLLEADENIEAFYRSRRVLLLLEDTPALNLPACLSPATACLGLPAYVLIAQH